MSRRQSTRAPLPRGFWVIWTTVALDLVGFGIVVPILARYAERFGASPWKIGVLGATFSAAQFVMAPIMGRISDRVGRKPVLIASLFGTAIGSLLCGAAGSLWLLFLGRAIDGASGASVSVAQGAVTDVISPADRPRALGLLGAAFGVGFVLGPAIGGLAAFGGPHVPFYVAAAIAGLNGLVAIRRLPETRGRTPKPVSLGGARRLVAGDLGRLAVTGLLSTIAFAGFEATFSLFGDRRFGLDEKSAAFVFLGIGLVLVLVQGGGIHPLTQRLGSARLAKVGLVLITLGLVALAGATSWPVFVVALFLLAVGQGVVVPSITSLVANTAGTDRRGEALGFQQSASALGRIVGPVGAGALFGLSIPTPYLVGAALCALAAIVLISGQPVESAVHGAAEHTSIN